MANMIALLVASRRKLGNEAAQTGLWNCGPPLIVYASEEAHMSIAKAADILGLGRDQVHVVDCDNDQRLCVHSLSREIERDHAKGDRKSTRLNSSHLVISYAVFCLKKKTKTKRCESVDE